MSVVDETKVQEFAEKMLGIINSSGLALMVSIGHRTGLFDTMAGLPPSTSAEIAKAAGLNERYVREWLGAMTTGRIVIFDADSGQYALPPEHAACLTRAASPNNIAVTTQYMALLGSVEDQIVDCFRNGGGVPYAAFGRFHEIMAEESAQSAVAGIKDRILPLIPGIIGRLEQGIDVLDVGCGRGRALIFMAQTWPSSRFRGMDLSPEAIADASRQATELKLTNIRFEQRDLTGGAIEGAFDLITAFDAIHDQARPDLVLAAIARALKPGGVFLMQDIAGSSHVHKNMDGPIAPFIYAISCMHCMTVSLAQGGMGLGAAWGRETAERMLHTAGFASVEVHEQPEDFINYYYVSRK